jgi:hypothetical protein
MGTRHLTAVIRKKEPVIAQYGQWDGYPEGQGTTVLDFLRKVTKNGGLKKFNERLDCVRFETEEDEKEMQKFMESIGCADGWMNMDQAAKYHKKYPYRTRDNGADILNMVANSKDKEIVLCNSMDFAADSLFCEWAYVIDLDKKVLEVYRGFNKRPLGKNQRFATLEKHNYGDTSKLGSDYNYFPVRCIRKYKFSELPTKRAFIKELVGTRDE